MRNEDKEKVCIDFLIDHADTLQIHEKDLKKWVDTKYFGMFSDHNNIYDAVRLIKIFLTHKINKIYVFNEQSSINYLENYPNELKKFKEKRGLK